MRILFITHADFESPGVIADWALSRGHDVRFVQPYHGDDPLQYQDDDFLIVMGGPQSPLETDRYPYLKKEIELIQIYLSKSKLVLGFCLGAQLIGEALGAQTERSPEKEIGVYPIELTPAATKDPLLSGMPRSLDVIHWHNDMPGLTADAVVLAQSAGCPRQIVRYRPKIYGFQCHLEITRDGIADLAAACPDDLKPSLYTQNKHDLLSNDYVSINKTMIQILDRLVEL